MPRILSSSPLIWKKNTFIFKRNVNVLSTLYEVNVESNKTYLFMSVWSSFLNKLYECLRQMQKTAFLHAF
jgi:hypothetical protein